MPLFLCLLNSKISLLFVFEWVALPIDYLIVILTFMKKIINSFSYAINGLKYTFKTQLNFKIHCLAATAAVILGLIIDLNQNEWLWIIFSISLVVILELVNTSIEILVDLVSPKRHPKAGAIKDIAAAAVLIAALTALIIGLFIFVPKLI